MDEKASRYLDITAALLGVAALASFMLRWPTDVTFWLLVGAAATWRKMPWVALIVGGIWGINS